MSIPNSTVFFEPLMRENTFSLGSKPGFFRKIKEIHDLGFYYYQPIPPNSEWEEAKMVFENLLKGQSVSLGLYNGYGLQPLVNAETFIIKFNKANLLSNWLMQHFEFSSIYLIRNPYATIASILHHQYSKDIVIEKGGAIPQFKFNQVFKKYTSIYSAIETKEEYFAFLWCLNITEGPLQIKEASATVVFYEDLIQNFDLEIKHLFRYLGKPIPKTLHENRFCPSLTSSKPSVADILSQKQLEAWKTHLTKTQKKRISSMLDKFNIDFYNEVDIGPDHDKFYSHIKNNHS